MIQSMLAGIIATQCIYRAYDNFSHFPIDFQTESRYISIYRRAVMGISAANTLAQNSHFVRRKLWNLSVKL